MWSFALVPGHGSFVALSLQLGSKELASHRCLLSFVWITVDALELGEGEDQALSVANVLIHHPSLELSVEQRYCLQQADTQERQMEERGQRWARLFSLICLDECFFERDLISTTCAVLTLLFHDINWVFLSWFRETVSNIYFFSL